MAEQFAAVCNPRHRAATTRVPALEVRLRALLFVFICIESGLQADGHFSGIVRFVAVDYCRRHFTWSVCGYAQMRILLWAADIVGDPRLDIAFDGFKQNIFSLEAFLTQPRGKVLADATYIGPVFGAHMQA